MLFKVNRNFLFLNIVPLLALTFLGACGNKNDIKELVCSPFEGEMVNVTVIQLRTLPYCFYNKTLAIKGELARDDLGYVLYGSLEAYHSDDPADLIYIHFDEKTRAELDQKFHSDTRSHLQALIVGTQSAPYQIADVKMFEFSDRGGDK